MAKNGKKPIDGLSEEKLKIRYPWIQGSQDALGKMDISSGDPNYPKEMFEAKVSPTGSTFTREYDEEKQEYSMCLNTGETRSYTTGSSSCHNDGHCDTSSESTIRQNSTGDCGVACKTLYQLAMDDMVKITKGTESKVTTSDSTSMTKRGGFGPLIEDDDGPRHIAVKDDMVTSVRNNNINMVEQGDYALHVQTGNYDCHVAANGRIFSDKDLLIESGTQITLKVGGSTIVIGPSNITIIADRIDLNP